MSVKEHISIKVCEPRARKDSGPWLLHGIRNVLLWGAHCHLLMISSILKSYLHIAVFFFPQHTRTYIQEDKLAGPFLRESYATMFCLIIIYVLLNSKADSRCASHGYGDSERFSVPCRNPCPCQIKPPCMDACSAGWPSGHAKLLAVASLI
jgi:hypothetical protein